MRRHSEVLENRRAEEAPGWAVEEWGWSRPLAANPGFEVAAEVIAPGVLRGGQTLRKGQYTAVVQEGTLWVREAGGDAVSTTRLQPGQSFSAREGARFELASTETPVAILVVRSAGARVDVQPTPPRPRRRGGLAPAPRLAPAPGPVAPPRRPQPSLEERAAIANMAQGLHRIAPLPGQGRTAADVQFGFNQHGVNLAPVVPEP